jgi:hypothetical protein
LVLRSLAPSGYILTGDDVSEATPSLQKVGTIDDIFGNDVEGMVATLENANSGIQESINADLLDKYIRDNLGDRYILFQAR